MLQAATQAAVVQVFSLSMPCHVTVTRMLRSLGRSGPVHHNWLLLQQRVCFGSLPQAKLPSAALQHPSLNIAA